MEYTLCRSLTLQQIKDSDAYKNLPAGYNKSRLNKDELCSLMGALYLFEQPVIQPTPVVPTVQPRRSSPLPQPARSVFITSDSLVQGYETTLKCYAEWEKVIPFLYSQIEEKKLPACIPQTQDDVYPHIAVDLNPLTLEVKDAEVPVSLYDDILNCPQPWVVVYLSVGGWTDEQGQPVEIRHGNILIFNKISGEMERFEPHGHETDLYDTESLDGYLRNFAASFGYKYVAPLDYCPRGPQALEAADWEIRQLCRTPAYCVAWSALYALMRLLNPEYTREEVLVDILKGRPSDLHTKVRKFTQFIETVLPD